VQNYFFPNVLKKTPQFLFAYKPKTIIRGTIQLFLKLQNGQGQHPTKGKDGCSKISSSQCALVSRLAFPHQVFVPNLRSQL